MGTKSMNAAGRRRLVVAATLLALAIGTAQGAPGAQGGPKLYRWVDGDGVVHYTDQIPPTQIDRAHTELSDQGIPVQAVPAAQTVEEIKRQRELERLRAQQERLVEQQNAADRVLLRTYRSVDDMMMARDGKLAAIEVVVQVARSNIRRQQAWLRNLRTEAANLERAGKPVPQHLEESIGKTERYIRDSYAAIVDREQQKNDVLQEYAADLKRFRRLKDIPEDASATSKEAGRPDLRNLVTCASGEQCDRYWARAVAYVSAHATTPVQTSGANILITAPPETREDLSLTLSRIQEKDGASASLFLDLQCKSASNADAVCKSERATKVLGGFRAAVADPSGKPDAGPGAEPDAGDLPSPDPSPSPSPPPVAPPR